jgi:hypothetical protein
MNGDVCDHQRSFFKLLVGKDQGAPEWGRNALKTAAAGEKNDEMRSW